MFDTAERVIFLPVPAPVPVATQPAPRRRVLDATTTDRAVRHQTSIARRLSAR